MLELDGSGGGGQLLRTALTLSAITGEPFHMTDVRGSRENPGLKAQHLTAVELFTDLCTAERSDVGLGSHELTFRPDEIRPDRYEVDIGTAGSISLLFDTVLPLALAVDEPLTVTATGGTDVKWSPPMDFYRRAKLPLLQNWGLNASIECHRHGFYPAGGGRATLHLEPSEPEPLELDERGELLGARVYSIAAEDLQGASVADRQATEAADRLESTGISVIERRATYVESDSRGSALVVVLDYEETAAGFPALGERGKPSEDVGRAAADDALAFQNGSGAVDPHLADQVIPFLSLAGGRVSIPEITNHVESAVDLVDAFGFHVEIEPRADGALLVSE